jgi:hypothetical protein
LEVRTVSVQTEGNRTHVKISVRALAGQKPDGASLPAILGYTEKEGARAGVQTSIPIGDVLKP